MLGKSLGFEVVYQLTPVVGCITETETADSIYRKTSFEEIIKRVLVFGVHKAGVIKSCRLTVSFKKSFSLFCKSVVIAILGH